MKITINLTKAELDLVEESLLQYQKLLLESENHDDMISYELKLCRRIFEEFGMEELETAVGVQQQVQSAGYSPPQEGPPSQVQAYAVPPQRQAAPSPSQQPSASYAQTPNQYPFSR